MCLSLAEIRKYVRMQQPSLSDLVSSARNQINVALALLQTQVITAIRVCCGGMAVRCSCCRRCSPTLTFPPSSRTRAARTPSPLKYRPSSPTQTPTSVIIRRPVYSVPAVRDCFTLYRRAKALRSSPPALAAGELQLDRAMFLANPEP
jgi:hypothetical protein